MAVEDKTRVESVVKTVVNGTSERLVDSAFTRDLDQVDATCRKINISGTTPVTIDLTEVENLNYLRVRGEYAADDTANNIAKGDPARVEVEVEGTFLPGAVMTELVDLAAGTLTSVRVRIPAAITQVVRVFVTIGAAG